MEEAKITLKKIKKFNYLNIKAWVNLLALWVLLYFLYSQINDIIFPIIATIIFFSLTIFVKHPQIFNYPVKITSQNMTAQYTNATRMVNYFRIIIITIANIILLGKKFLVRTDHPIAISLLLVLIILLLVFIPLIIFIGRSFRMK